MSAPSQELVLLVDYKGEYFPRHKRTSSVTDLELLRAELEKRGVSLEVLPFAEVDLRARDFSGKLIAYQSSQDPGLFYKGFIEDTLLALQMQGAILLPAFELFRAHHNKVMMEKLRDLSSIDALKNLAARSFGTLEDFKAHVSDLSFPAVMKKSDGDSAQGVVLVHDQKEALKAAENLMGSFVLKDAYDNTRRKITAPEIKPHSLHRRKIIVQPFIAGLDHDYKVLFFGDRLFLETRPTREGDFRASGSLGDREFPQEPPAGMLDLVEEIGLHYGSPYASVDIMFNGEEMFVGEMQFLRFGTAPVLKAPHCFERRGGEWGLVEGPFVWEAQLAHGLSFCLQRRSAD